MSQFIDYYEILGIRPSASIIEINIAYKGRRAQYHPDKYVNTDSDTIQWATQKMQEVNQAYEILSDDEKRSQYHDKYLRNNQSSQDNDQSKQRNNSQNNNKSRSAPEEEYHADNNDEHTKQNKKKNENLLKEPSLLDYLYQANFHDADKDRIYFGNNIPRNKLLKAISARTLASQQPPKKVSLLIDDTVFGGAAEGLLITDEFISFKEIFLRSKDYSFLFLGKNNLFEAHKTSVRWSDGEKCTDFVMLHAETVQSLVWLMNQYLIDRYNWLEKIAKNGDSDAQFYMSLRFPYDKKKTLYWLTRSAKQGNINAQHNLGVALMGIDEEESFRWLTLAMENGNKVSRRFLNDTRFNKYR